MHGHSNIKYGNLSVNILQFSRVPVKPSEDAKVSSEIRLAALVVKWNEEDSAIESKKFSSWTVKTRTQAWFLRLYAYDYGSQGYLNIFFHS